jgi:hypothetical protein
MEVNIMGKRIDWDQVAELAEKIREQGLSLAEGAKMFGMPVWKLYGLSRRKKEESTAVGGQDSGQEIIDCTESQPYSAPDSESVSVEDKVEDDPFAHSPVPVEIQQLIIGYSSASAKVRI